MFNIIKMLKNRIEVSACKYGDLVETKLEQRIVRDELHNAQYRIRLYKNNNNAEYLLDAINFIMFEYMDMTNAWDDNKVGAWNRTSDSTFIHSIHDTKGTIRMVDNRLKKYNQSGDIKLLIKAANILMYIINNGTVVATDNDPNSRII